VPLINPYCTVAEVQKELRNTDSALNAELETAINQASRWIDDYKGRDYFLHDHSVSALVIRATDGDIVQDELFLPYYPIITLTSVTVKGTTWTENTDFVRDTRRNRLISVDGEWDLSEVTDKVDIVGKFGYDQASSAAVPTGLPLHINKAAILVAAAFSGHNRKEAVGLDGGKTEVIEKDIPQVVFKILGARAKAI